MASDDTARIIQREKLLDEHCGVGLWSVLMKNGDPSHPENEWNFSSELRRLLGYQSEAEFPNDPRSISESVHPDDVEHRKEAYQKMLSDRSGRSEYDIRYRLKTKSGDYRWFNATGGCKFQEDGSIHACGALVDIDDSVTAQERADEEAARMQLYLSAAGIGLWSCHIRHGDAAHPDSEWFWSTEFRRLLGFDSADNFPDLMTSWSDRLHPDDVDATFAAFSGHLQDQTDRTRYQVRYRLKMRDGSWRWFSATGGCKHMPDGTIWACGSLNDIHEAVMLQEKVAAETQQDSDAITMLSELLAARAEGDMSRQIDTDVPEKMADLKASFNSMGLRLSELINEVKGTAHSMLDEAGSISDGANELQRRAQTQAASIEQTAAALEQISGNISMTSDNAKHADSAAIAAKEKTDRGEKIVESVIAVMEQIEQHTKEISKITGIIETFAFQTNLLSINAAVEAARAGEVGRGFAVVATEVRNLAQQSSNASKNINELISKSAGDVARGVELVREAGEALGEIGGAVSAMASSVADIANASSEQSIGVGEISSAISQIDSATQSNLSLSESNTGSAQTLQQNLSSLVERVSIFRTAGGGQTARSYSAASDDDWARELGDSRRAG